MGISSIPQKRGWSQRTVIRALLPNTLEITNVNITSNGRPVLGSPIGTPEYISSFVEHKVQEWVKELDNLSMFAELGAVLAISIIAWLNSINAIMLFPYVMYSNDMLF